MSQSSRPNGPAIDFASRHPDELRRNEGELRALVEERRAVPHVGAVFPLDDVVAALRLVADGRAIRKVVIDLAG